MEPSGGLHPESQPTQPQPTREQLLAEREELERSVEELESEYKSKLKLVSDFLDVYLEKNERVEAINKQLEAMPPEEQTVF
jgi:hypothetical protein